MFVDGVAKRCFVIITTSDGFDPLVPLRTADLVDFPTTAPNKVSAVAAARSDDVDLYFRRLTYCFFSSLQKTLGSNHVYSGEDVAMEELTYLTKFRERCDFLQEVFFTLPEEITVPLNTVRAPKK